MRALCAGRSGVTSSTITVPAVTYRFGRTPRTEGRLSRPSSATSPPYPRLVDFIIGTSAEQPEPRAPRVPPIISAGMRPSVGVGHPYGRAPDSAALPASSSRKAIPDRGAADDRAESSVPAGWLRPPTQRPGFSGATACCGQQALESELIHIGLQRPRS
jgi:hypothetical protein